MARENLDIYQIGSSPEQLQSALISLRNDYDNHIHDGTSSKSFLTLTAETISARTMLIRKTSYTDNTSGIWMGFTGSLMKLNLGTATNFLKWDGSALSISGSITATSGTIGGWTIAATSLTGGNITLSTATVSAASGTIKLDGANTKLYVGSGITLDGAGSGTITGGTIQTATSGQRIVLSSSANEIGIYDSSQQVGKIYGSSSSIWLQGTVAGQNPMTLVNSSSTVLATINSNGTFALAVANQDFFVTSSGAYAWLTNNVELNSPGSGLIGSLGTFVPDADNSYDLGSTSKYWANLFVKNSIKYGGGGTVMPVLFDGYVSGTTVSNANNSFTVTNPSTGNYTITHNIGSAVYNIQVTALRASGAGAYIAKVAAINANTVDIIVFDDAGTAVNGDFMFLISF